MSSTSSQDPYQPQNIALFEALYGKHLISLGGTTAIDNMFSDIHIENTQALDIGFGMGGVAYYLAQKYNTNISGVELYRWMVDYAEKHTPSGISSQLAFKCYLKNGDMPFNADSFDIAYSKGVLNHVKHKTALFKQIYTQLKKNGLFVIADWIYPDEIANQTGPLVCETKASYEQALIRANFKTITFRDDSSQFLAYVQNFLNNLSIQRTYIEENYGQELFLYLKDDHIKLLHHIKTKNKIAIRITAKK
ncbi:MAG: methyltransferase domain-containing protein [Legionellaceae bacterium]|nr:methyltransferase domain-containing protein [Legionellaceae bacterium]